MKKIPIILLLTVAAFIKETNAQPGVPDTLAYLQSIVANKAQFIGQPFSKLNDSLKIQIKFFSPFASIPYDKTKETSTSFAFYFPLTADEMYLTYPKLEVHWQAYLNSTQSHQLYNSNNGGGWSTSVASFYALGVITDIKVRE